MAVLSSSEKASSRRSVNSRLRSPSVVACFLSNRDVLPLARDDASATRSAPMSRSMLTSTSAATFFSSQSIQVPKWSCHPSTSNCQTPKVSGMNSARQRSLPMSVIRVSTHRLAPAWRCLSIEPMASWPSPKTSASIVTGSPTTLFAANRPPSTWGDAASITTRPIVAGIFAMRAESSGYGPRPWTRCPLNPRPIPGLKRLDGRTTFALPHD